MTKKALGWTKNVVRKKIKQKIEKKIKKHKRWPSFMILFFYLIIVQIFCIIWASKAKGKQKYTSVIQLNKI